ncbi:MAG: Ig-like domain-containing protein, partial [SAR324 cluster bacterium]|nr:Ig-like domain-containing protein [SAR324 cluster bacterium]
DLNECGTGQYVDNTGKSWPESYYGCQQTVYAWFEDYAGNIAPKNKTIEYDPSYAEVVSLVSDYPSVKQNSDSPYYKANDTIDLKLSFTENLGHSETRPSIYIKSDNGSSIKVDLFSDADKDNHTYRYTVSADDNISQLSQFSDNFSYNGGFMQEESHCYIDNLTLPEPGSSHSLAPNSDITIDTIPPTLILNVFDADNSTSTPDSLTDQTTIGFKLVASDDRGIKKWELFNGNIKKGPVDVDNVTEFSISDNHTLLDNSSNIIQTISARVTDLAGNTSVVSDNITLDNILPKISYITLYYNSAKGGLEPDNGTGIIQINTSDSHQNLKESSVYAIANLLNSNPHDNHSYPINLDQISIKFDEAISNVLTTDNGSSGSAEVTCTGLVKISSDNFSSNNKCRELGLPTTTDNLTWDINLIRLSNGSGNCPNHYQNGTQCKATLMDNMSYFLKIHGFKDFTNNLGDNVSVGFKTTEGPDVVNSFPTNESTKVSVYTAPQVTFSKYMDPDSFVAGDTVRVSCSPSPDEVHRCDFVPRLDFYNKKLEIHPRGRWPEDTKIKVTIRGAFENGSSIHGAYAYLQGGCGTQGPGIRDEGKLTQGGTAPYYNCGEYSDDRVFLKNDHQFSFTTRGNLDNASSGLVLHYTLDNNTLDHSDADGSFQDLDNTSLASVEGRDNESHGAYLFNSSGFLDLPVGSIPSGSFSICLWSYNGNYPSTKSTLFSMGSSGVGSSLSLGYTSSGKPFIDYGNDSLITLNVNYGILKWTHLCLIRNNNLLNFYADGGNVLSSDNLSLSLGATSFRIGQKFDGTNVWNGRIDDFKLYDRSLESDEVFDLYFEESRNLEGFFPLAGDAKDHSGNNRDGTSGRFTSSSGWDGTSGNALQFDNTTNDDIEVPLLSSLHTPDFTLISWGFPETTATNRTKYKPLLSTAKMEKHSMSSLGGFEASGFNTCTWSSKTEDNVTLSSEDGFSRSAGGGLTNLTTSLSGNLDTGHGIKINSIKNNKDNSTYSNSFESVRFGSVYLVHKVDDSKIKFIDPSNLNASELSNVSYQSLEIGFQVCDNVKISLLGNAENINITLADAEGQKTGSFQGWFLEHHRSDKEDGLHYQRYREFHTDNSSNKFDCYDTYLLKPEDHCPAITNLDDETTKRDTVDYKAWQQLAVRGDGQDLSLFRNAEIQASTTSRNTNLRYHDNLTIGAINSDYQYKGRIDDVRLYSRPLTDREIKTLYAVVDIHAPVPGDSGKLIFSGNTLSWSKAFDDINDNSSLKYRVVKNTEDRIQVVETAMRNGVVLCNWDNCSGLSLQNLNESAFYNVLVKDNAGNINSYQKIKKN